MQSFNTSKSLHKQQQTDVVEQLPVYSLTRQSLSVCVFDSIKWVWKD